MLFDVRRCVWLLLALWMLSSCGAGSLMQAPATPTLRPDHHSCHAGASDCDGRASVDSDRRATSGRLAVRLIQSDTKSPQPLIDVLTQQRRSNKSLFRSMALPDGT
jgi:hypothetical protein